MRWIAAAIACVPMGAGAYCIYNQIDRPVRVEQETHPDKLRDDRRLRATILPGGSQCCRPHELDCNPLGRNNSVLHLAITIPGDPPYACGFPAGTEPNVKVTGAGTIRVQRNPRRKSADPYIVRVRTHDGQNITGPRGLVCPEFQPKGKR